MKKLQIYFKQFTEYLRRLWYSDTARDLRYRLDTFLEQIDDRLDDLIENQNPDKHRLKGQLLHQNEVLSRNHDGFNLCGMGINPNLSMQNVLINGESGSYKTAGAIIRSILTVQGSQIIHDPSSELYEKTSQALSQFGFKIMRLDFSNPSTSVGYNPLSRIENLSEISNFASNLVRAEKDSFWNTKATELLVVVITAVKNLPKNHQTMSNVCYLLDLMQTGADKDYIDAFFSKFTNTKILTKFLSIISNSEATLSSIISTAQTAVQIFDLDENIARICSTDTLGDFNDFRTQPTVLFIHSNIAKMQYYAKITSLFLNQYMESFFKRLPYENELDVYFHLDETPVLEIQNLDVIASNIRKYRGALMLVCQNAKSQLKSKYGEKAEAILTNVRTKVYFSADLPIARELEAIIGKYDFVDAQDNDRMKTRSVLSADEIVALPSDKCLIHISGMRPILAKVKPYFHFRDLKEFTSLTPYPFTENTELHSPELLDLKKMFPNLNTQTP